MPPFHCAGCRIDRREVSIGASIITLAAVPTPTPKWNPLNEHGRGFLHLHAAFNDRHIHEFRFWTVGSSVGTILTSRCTGTDPFFPFFLRDEFRVDDGS